MTLKPSEYTTPRGHAATLLQEQVSALFANVGLGVSSAALAALAVAFSVTRVGNVSFFAATSWSGFVVACALAHLILRWFYYSSRVNWSQRAWAGAFTAIAFAEGMAWGWAPATLTAGQAFDIELFTVAVTSGVCGGAIPAFGSYTPCFFAFLLPATIPFFCLNIGSVEPLRQISAIMELLLLFAMSGLGLKANRNFAELVGLRLATEDLAHALRKQKDLAEQANAAKSAFLAAASHDLRQPIHALSLFIGALRGMRMPAEAKGVLRKIEESTTAMDGLFAALLDISKLDAGVVEVKTKPFDLHTLIARVCADHLREAESKEIELRHVRSSVVAHSDPLLVERILRNLISNAVRYTKTGGVIVGCRRSGRTVRIVVSDSGPGIPEEAQAQIFEEYYQLSNPERDRTKGLGLGLAIVRRLASLLQADLSLRSIVGRGSTFSLNLPLSQEKPTNDAPEQVDFSILSRGLVVVIDDEQPIREAMSLLLQNWGHQVITAESGSEALQRLRSCSRVPDLIISDYRLRLGETGIAAIDLLRAELESTVPAMLITGDTAPDRLHEAQASGLVLLHKPIQNGKLRAAINNIMAQQTDHRGRLLKLSKSDEPAAT
jgi:signal transduction histidine kinase/CheY-like chemotaxis protein